MGSAFVLLAKNWKAVLGIVVIYGILNAVLVQGFKAAGDLTELKLFLDELFVGGWSQLASGVTVFTYMLGSSGNTINPKAGAYQLILILLVSLALIWILRNAYAGNKLRVRDSLYKGMAPLVPFVLVLVVVCLQLIPLAIGLSLYTTVTSSQIAATGLEQLLWALLAFMLGLLSMYMISSSLFALYIVTLPDMTPMKALRSARQLVANRRWFVMLKILFLPVSLLLLAGILVVPVILLATPYAVWVFFVVSMLLLPVMHSYMYTLYRSLL